MKLADYIKPLNVDARRALATKCGTTWLHLRNVAFSGKPCGVQLAVALEQATNGQVRRVHLRPQDWHLIWPELIGTEGATAIQEELPDAA